MIVDRGMKVFLKLTKTEIADLFYGLRNDPSWQGDPVRVRKALLDVLSLQLKVMGHFALLWVQIERLDDAVRKGRPAVSRRRRRPDR